MARSKVMSLKAAPRRQVLEVSRTGDWGEVRYLHRLECGHVEVRRRRSPSENVACSSCMTEGRLRKRVAFIEAIDNLPDDHDQLSYELAVVESNAVRIRAEIAARLGIPLDCVDVLVSDFGGRMSIASATVHIDGPMAMEMLNIRRKIE